MNSKLAPNIPINVIKDIDIKFNNDQNIEFKINANQNLCIDNTNNTLYALNCIQNINQQYLVNPVKKQILDPNKNVCLDVDSYNKITWSACNESNLMQQYIFNPKTNQITNPNNKMCMDINTNNIVNGSSSFILNQCSNNINQQFIPYLINTAYNNNKNNSLNTIQGYIDDINSKLPDTINGFNAGQQLENIVNQTIQSINENIYADFVKGFEFPSNLIDEINKYNDLVTIFDNYTKNTILTINGINTNNVSDNYKKITDSISNLYNYKTNVNAISFDYNLSKNLSIYESESKDAYLTAISNINIIKNYHQIKITTNKMVSATLQSYILVLEYYRQNPTEQSYIKLLRIESIGGYQNKAISYFPQNNLSRYRFNRSVIAYIYNKNI